MIVVIGGTSCVGKTVLAHEIMKMHALPYLSIDHLMMGIYRSNKNCGYTPESETREIVKVIWPILKEMIKTNIENKNDFVYEGFQIVPENIEEVEQEYRNNIMQIFLGFSESYITTKYSVIKAKRNIIEQRTDLESKDTMIKKNREFITKCNDHNIKPYIIKEDYETEIEQIRKEINLTIASTLTRSLSSFLLAAR